MVPPSGDEWCGCLWLMMCGYKWKGVSQFLCLQKLSAKGTEAKANQWEIETLMVGVQPFTAWYLLFVSVNGQCHDHGHGHSSFPFTPRKGVNPLPCSYSNRLIVSIMVCLNGEKNWEKEGSKEERSWVKRNRVNLYFL